MLTNVAKFSDRLPPLGLTRAAKVSDRTRLKILTPKQMLQRLPIALVQVKAGSMSKNVLNQICQMIYYLHQVKEITKQLYNKTMNSIMV